LVVQGARIAIIAVASGGKGCPILGIHHGIAEQTGIAGMSLARIAADAADDTGVGIELPAANLSGHGAPVLSAAQTIITGNGGWALLIGHLSGRDLVYARYNVGSHEDIGAR
jgi:hypothetical protein